MSVRSSTRLVLATTLGAVLAACAADEPSAPAIDCATADVKPFSELGAVFAHCTGCHSGSDAPEGVRFDNYADAAADALRGASEIADGAMPPGGGLSEDDAQAFLVWARCGTPE